MSRVAIFVRKRNGQPEPFAIGKIAMAVYKALQAHDPKVTPTQARLLGSKIAISIEHLLLQNAHTEVANSEKHIVDLEYIQDLVIQNLIAQDLSNVAQRYEAYRIQRTKERESKYSDFGEPFFVNHKKYSQAALINHLLSSDLQSKHQHSIKTLQIPLKNKSWFTLYETIFMHCYQNVQGEPAELDFLNWLYSQLAYSKHLLTVSFIDSPEHIRKLLLEQCFTHAQKAFDASAFPILPQDTHPPLKAHLLFDTYFRKDPMVLILANVALRLHPENPNLLFSYLLSGCITLPLQVLDSIHQQRSQICFEKAITLGDSTEAIFEGLLNIAKAVKAGCSVSVSLSSIRAQGLPVGDNGNKSAGIIPIANLIGQTCSMLSGIKGEPHKARIFLDVWHSDLESFLSFFIQSEHSSNIKTALFVSDIFMKRVLEGKDWIMGTPEELPNLKNAKSLKERAAAIEQYCNDYDQLQPHSPSLKKIPARTVFDWICKAIATGKGPAIIFKDIARGLDSTTQRALPSSRLGTLLMPDQDDIIIELGLSLTPQCHQAQLLEVCRTLIYSLQNLQKNPLPLALGICYLPPSTPQDYTQFSAALLSIIGRKWTKELSFWSTKEPFLNYRKSIYKSREGYLENVELPSWNSDNAPPTARCFTQNPREEYLAFHSGNAPWSPQEGLTCQYKGTDRTFGTIRFEKSTLEQAKSVAAWQSLTDQLLTWDVYLKNNSEYEVAEAIKVAWLYGINVIRRFHYLEK